MLSIITEIKKLASEIGRDIKLMEVCGTHTQVIAENGIKNLLPPNIKLISGPGCPVCVTSQQDIDAAVSLAMAGIPVASYGDMIKVKGLEMSLADAREAGAAVKEIYSAEELFNQKKDFIFFGIGFETTAPMTAVAIKKGIKVYSAHKIFIPALKALLAGGEIKVDGLISPGHVAAIVGADAFGSCKSHRDEASPRLIPQVITGFEVLDVLKGIAMLLKQIAAGRAEVENKYTRVVKPEGNRKALKLLEEVFKIEDSDWRGLGIIPHSGFEIRDEYADMDAKRGYKSIITRKYAKKNTKIRETGCLCADVIKGNIEPRQCPSFCKKCSPDNPQGPCMVSREGACYISSKYRVSSIK